MVPTDTLLEAATREEIDKNLGAAGWVVQDKNRINLYVKLGVAVDLMPKSLIFAKDNMYGCSMIKSSMKVMPSAKNTTYKLGKKISDETIRTELVAASKGYWGVEINRRVAA